MSKRINVILIGATGHIGSWVHRRLVENGHHVTACSRNAVRLPPEIMEHTTWMSIDLSNQDSLHKAFASRPHDFFIHLASEKVIGAAESDPAEAIEVNVGGTARVLAAAALAGVKRGVFASTWAVYAPNDIFDLKYTEDFELSPTTVYGDTKKIGEELCRTYMRTGSVPNITILRFFNTVGGPAYEGAVEQLGFFNYVSKAVRNNDQVNIAGLQFPTPDGACYRDFIDVRDVADVVSGLAISEAGPGVFNIGSGTAYSLVNVVDSFEAVAGKKIERGVSESRPGDPAYVCADTEKARKELNFKPVYTIEDSINASLSALT